MLNLIIPMAGKGRRMLPHTLTTPKPLIPIAGKPIVERLVQAIKMLYQGPIAHIGFVVKDLTAPMQLQLEDMAISVGAQPHCYEQVEALGTAHAIACAAPLLKGPVIVAFSDTLFNGSEPLDLSKENIVLVSRVQDPSSFGVVQLGPDNMVNSFVEKPTHFVSDLAIIGIYYFSDGEVLYQFIQSLMADGISYGGEYQLTSVLTCMQQQGSCFYPQTVKTWLDCGNKTAALHTNQYFLHLLQEKEDLVAPTAQIQNSKIIHPVYLGPGVHIHGTILGPYVSVGSHTYITGSCIQNSIIQEHTKIENSNLQNSMIGSHVHIQGKPMETNVGDYTMLLL